MKNLNRLLFAGYSGKSNAEKRIFLFIFLIISAIFSFTGCATREMNKGPVIHVLEGPKMQVQKDHLKPGLSVLYFQAFYRHIDEMPKGRIAIARGISGEPIPMLNHHFGEEIMVFKSGRAQGVGMQMDGFILFEKPGDYVFQAKSNDGFRMLINDLEIIDDPTVHSDRMSERGIVKVSEPGWYPLRILYFQRKKTATIQLFWTKPGDEKKVIVPPEAYAHIPA